MCLLTSYFNLYCEKDLDGWLQFSLWVCADFLMIIRRTRIDDGLAGLEKTFDFQRYVSTRRMNTSVENEG
jgi:hypothetical protein